MGLKFGVVGLGSGWVYEFKISGFKVKGLAIKLRAVVLVRLRVVDLGLGGACELRLLELRV